MTQRVCHFCGRAQGRHWIGWVLYPWTGEAHTWRVKKALRGTETMYEFEAFKHDPTYRNVPEGVRVTVDVYACMTSRVEIRGTTARLFDENGKAIGELPIPFGYSSPPDLLVEIVS